ncbi:MAG: hypothetical protein ACO1RX_08430 [Candidatus Sericytochromatia bacterium]
MVDFLQNNTAPDLVGRDNNFAVELYFAPKAAGLTSASTSGWRRAGATEPGSYAAEFTTNVNSTMLGTTKTKKSFHINEQGATLSANLTEITPFGLDLVNKTNLIPSVTYGTAAATVDISGGGLQMLTLSDATDFSAGSMVEIAIGSGASAYTDYRRVESVNGDTITLESPLDEAPAAGAEVKDVTSISWKRGGVTLARRSYVGVISGDNGDTIVHYAKDTVMTSGKSEYPDANVGKNTLQFEVVAQTQEISGRKQPVLLEETLNFA